MYTIEGKYTSALITIDTLDEATVGQITSFVNHPAFTAPVAIMPDAHYGSGSCIGFTMPLTEKLIPAVIGVDIGCGVLGVNLGKELPVSLSDLDARIREKVPMGMAVHSRGIIHMKKEFPWKKVQDLAHKFILAHGRKFPPKEGPLDIEVPTYDMDWFENKCKAIGGDITRMINSLGTLGGNNHFIEIGKDLQSNYWLTIHTGSRNFGKRIAEYHQKLAAKNIQRGFHAKKQEELEQARRELSGEELGERVNEIRTKYGPYTCYKGLEFLEGVDALNYLYDMLFSQIYAEVNRDRISRIIFDILGVEVVSKVETVHNCVDFNDMVIRKGAVRSNTGELFMIPFNMRDGILLCEGKSNPEWNSSAPHGAGRIMSRAKAKDCISLEVYQEQMKGIYTTSVGQSTLDEAPNAYKDCHLIEGAIGPTAIVMDRIKPVLNMKATEVKA